MTKRQEDVDHFIRLIRGLSPQWLRYACTHGSCHRFYLVLKNRFKTAVPYKTVCDDGGHVVSKIYGKYWDIWGEHEPEKHGEVSRFSKEDLDKMSSCVFDEGYVLQNTKLLLNFDKQESLNG